MSNSSQYLKVALLAAVVGLGTTAIRSRRAAWKTKRTTAAIVTAEHRGVTMDGTTVDRPRRMPAGTARATTTTTPDTVRAASTVAFTAMRSDRATMWDTATRAN